MMQQSRLISSPHFSYSTACTSCDPDTFTIGTSETERLGECLEGITAGSGNGEVFRLRFPFPMNSSCTSPRSAGRHQCQSSSQLLVHHVCHPHSVRGLFLGPLPYNSAKTRLIFGTASLHRSLPTSILGWEVKRSSHCLSFSEWTNQRCGPCRTGKRG